MQHIRWSSFAMMTICSALAQQARAVTITWSGGAGTNSWHTPANWDLIRVPAAGDDVVIPDMTPNVNVTHSTGTTTINSLTSAEAFTLPGGSTLNIDAASSLNSSFSLAGVLGGAGDVTVNGAMTWTGGTLGGTGRTIIAPTASLTISTSSSKSLFRRLENHSANASWTDGSFQMLNGTLSNESDGTFTANLVGSLTFSNSGGTNAVTNAGTFNKAGAGTITVNTSIAFNNTDTVNLDAGGLTINGGGTNSGIIDADAGTTLMFQASYTHDNASSLTGQGTLTFSIAGTHTLACTLSGNRNVNINNACVVNLNAPYTLSGTVNLFGANLSGTGDVTITGTLNWTNSGAMTGTGRTIIAAGGSLAASDGFQKQLTRRLENHSSNATFTATTIRFDNGTLINEADGTLTISQANIFQNGSGLNAISNAGTFNKTGAGTTTINAGIAFNNTGTLNVDAGGLTISGGGTSSGLFDLDSGTTLTCQSAYTFAAGAGTTGAGSLNIPITLTCTSAVSLGSITNLTGTLNGAGDVTVNGAMNWTATGMSGTGRTIIANGGSLNVGGINSLTLQRRLENHSPNTIWTNTSITLGNGVLSNESDGTILFNLAGNLNFNNGGGTNAISNAGILNKTGAGTLVTNANIPFNNTGTVNLDAGGMTINGGGTNSSVIDADAGTTLMFQASYTHNNASSLIGQGTLTFSITGTHNLACTLSANRIVNINSIVNFNAPYTIGTVNLTGTFGGTGDVTITGTLNWTNNGAMTGTGRTIIASSASLSVSDGFLKLFNRRLENHSPSAIWTATSVSFNNGTLTNESDGNFTFNLSFSNTINSTGGTNAVANAGIMNKTGTGTLTIGSNIPLTNSGMLKVQAGILVITSLTNFSGTTLTGGIYDVAGTLRFSGANIVTNAAGIVLDGPVSAIQNTSVVDALQNFATNSATGSFQIKNGRNFARTGSFTNLGQVQIGPEGAGFNATGIYTQPSGTTTIDGGTLDPTDAVDIQGGELTGNGAVLASVTNSGTISVPSGLLAITSLTNQSGTTLTNGIYNVAGILRFNNASIGSNAANIVLDGTTSAIQDGSGADALADFGSNLAAGTFQIKNGRNQSRIGSFSNSGQMRIGPGASTISASGNYVQSSGTTTLDGGTLDPTDLADIQGGEIKGNGSVQGNVTNSGTCRPGFSPGSINISGDYTQTSSGTLEAEIGGTTANTEYDQLSVTGRVILLGTLRILLINSFNPTIGSTFDVATGNPISTKFTSIVLPTLATLKGFQIEALDTALRMIVIDCGPGDADGDGVGDACETAPDLSWYTIDGGGRTFSSGGQFRVGASIGQPDAGSFTTPLTGGGFTLISGFWPGTVIPECSLLGDMNLDTRRDGIDVQVFLNCVLGSGSECSCADMDDNGVVNNADIPPFVQILLN